MGDVKVQAAIGMIEELAAGIGTTDGVSGYQTSYLYDPETEILHANVRYTLAVPLEYIRISVSAPDS